MNQYKENTVGWWLSQLKEPLRSRALAEYSHRLESIAVIISLAFIGDTPFWAGVIDALAPTKPRYMDLNNKDFMEGYNMAKECAPDPAQKFQVEVVEIPPSREKIRIETIEFRHDREIKELQDTVAKLERRVTQLENVIATKLILNKDGK